MATNIRTSAPAFAAEIVTLTPSPALDITASVERVVPLSKMRCGEVRHDPGGGGINVARVLRRFGVTAKAVFPAGGGNGELLKRLLKQEDIFAVSVPIAADTRQDFTVFERQGGAQYRFVFPGSPLTASEVGALTATLDEIRPAPELLIVSGSFPENTDVAIFAATARVIAATKAKLVVDTTGASLASALKHPVYLIKPNLHELEDLTQSSLNTEDLRLGAVRTLLREKKIELIALTLGADGAVLASRDGVWRGSAPKVQPQSTVGAGDSFMGGLVWQLSRGASCADTLRFAIAAGSAALLAPGTELCRIADIEALLPEVRVSQV